MVEPTNLKPPLLQILADPIEPEAACSPISSSLRHWFHKGTPSTPTETRRSFELSTTSKTASRYCRVDLEAVADDPRVLHELFHLRLVVERHLGGSNPSKASRYASRFLRIVIHERPACAPSRTKSSNSSRSSWVADPLVVVVIHVQRHIARPRASALLIHSSEPFFEHRRYASIIQDRTASTHHERIAESSIRTRTPPAGNAGLDLMQCVLCDESVVERRCPPRAPPCYTICFSSL